MAPVTAQVMMTLRLMLFLFLVVQVRWLFSSLRGAPATKQSSPCLWPSGLPRRFAPHNDGSVLLCLVRGQRCETFVALLRQRRDALRGRLMRPCRDDPVDVRDHASDAFSNPPVKDTAGPVTSQLTGPEISGLAEPMPI